MVLPTRQWELLKAICHQLMVNVDYLFYFILNIKFLFILAHLHYLIYHSAFDAMHLQEVDGAESGRHRVDREKMEDLQKENEELRQTVQDLQNNLALRQVNYALHYFYNY